MLNSNPLSKSPGSGYSRKYHANYPLNGRGVANCGMIRRMQVPLLVAMACLDLVVAELPMIDTQPFLGYFAVSTKGRMDFRVEAQDARMVLAALDKSKTPVGLPLVIYAVIDEIQPSGQANPIQVKALDSADAATEKFKKVVIVGKTVGEASFEMTIEEIQGTISIGGRMLEQGTFKNPLRFSIRTDFPNFYVYVPRETADEKKAFQKMAKKDHIELKWTDGERKKLTWDIALDAASKEFNGPGISTAEINVAGYVGARFLFTESGDSSLRLTTARPGPWIEQFSMVWTPNTPTAKDGKSRLMIDVK